VAHHFEYPEGWADACCTVCPAQRLDPGEFDVVEPPLPGQAFVDGIRVMALQDTPICIHPWRVGLPPGRYASAGAPLPSELQRPTNGCLMRHPDSGEHPYRVGMPAGAYKSAGVPVPNLNSPAPAPTPEALELPERLEDLEGWLVAVLRSVPPERMFGAVARAEREAGERFPPRDVVTAMRRVMSRELLTRSSNLP